MKSPHDLLPVIEPRLHQEEPRFFYDNVLMPLVQDVIRIQSNGIPIDTSKTEDLKAKLDEILTKVHATLADNKLVKEFQVLRGKAAYEKYKAELEAKKKPMDYFVKPFGMKNANHRAALCNSILDGLGKVYQEKWTIKDIKLHPYLSTNHHIQVYLDGNCSNDGTVFKQAMLWLSTRKATLINMQYDYKIQYPPPDLLDRFNPGSSLQKQEFFDWLNIESEATSKTTGLPSWDKDQVKRINRETEDTRLEEVTQAMIDFSQAAIIRQNFIAAFDKFVVDNTLYGNFKLFGAKSMRLTSNQPNLLNMPSTGSVFAKPIKECLIAPKGWVVLTADYNALEDRVLASITKDPGKVAIQLDPELDGHCYNAAGYFKDKVEAVIGTEGTHVDKVKRFASIVESDDHPDKKVLKGIRQDSKPVTFGIAYGAYPPKIAASIKCPIEQAEQIFNSYHNELYPEVTKYREEYILETAKKEGRIHLGLGCYINSSNPRKEIRTINNASIQFWSILTLLAINKMHELIDAAGYEEDIKCVATIYDSIYYIVKEDTSIIKWLNDNLITTMSKDFLIDQTVPNTAESEIGLNWSELHAIDVKGTEEHIANVLAAIKN